MPHTASVRRALADIREEDAAEIRANLASVRAATAKHRARWEFYIDLLAERGVHLGEPTRARGDRAAAIA